MLEHVLWAPGHLTVRTIATRRAHLVEVDRDGRRIAEGDADGLLRAVDGLVLAEAPLKTIDPAVDLLPRAATGRRPATDAVRTPSLFADELPSVGTPDARRSARPGTPSTVGDAWPTTAGHAAPAAPTAAAPGTALRVEVFGRPQGWVVATRAVDGLRRRVLEAELVVDGRMLGRLATLGARGEEAVVRDAAGGALSTLARFDHLRGVQVTTSSWDLDVRPVEDPRLRVLALVAVLRMPALWSAAIGRDPRRRGLARRRSA